MSPKEVKLTPEQRERILRNIWLSHDGRWFLKSAEEFGFDTAAKLNLVVTESIGKTEMKQLIAETGYGEIKNIEDFKALMEIASIFPKNTSMSLRSWTITHSWGMSWTAMSIRW